MPDSRTEQIAQLRRSIASLEATQRQTGIDLSGSIAIQQRLLAQLEPEPSQVSSSQSGGVEVTAEQVAITGDVVGRDKITSNTMTTGDILINSTKIVYTSGDPALDQARLAKYLNKVRKICAPMKVAAINQGAAKPGATPLGLTSVYVDLNLDLKIPANQTLVQYLERAADTKRGTKVDLEARETRGVPVLEALAQCSPLVLLGKPGSGKSTLSTYLALSLAEAGLDVPGAIERLGQTWTQGPLLPVRVILRQFAESLPATLKRGRAEHLWTFINAEVKSYGIHAELGELLQKVADQSGALFLFDGLDEAGDESRRARVLEAVTDFMSTAGDRCRFLITARPYAWEDTEQRIAQAPHVYRLADFEFDQIDLFIVRWYDALFTLGWVEDERTSTSKTRELQAAVRRIDLRTLAANPLLLTLMATLHSNRTTRLPDDRVKVYDEVVELLLERWHRLDEGDRSPLEALGITVSQVRNRMAGLAFETHTNNVGQRGTADIAEAALSAAFRPLLGGSHDQAQQVIQYIEQRAGLLVSQGMRQHQRQFTFPHRAFQEYLAACHLADQRDFETRAYALATTAPEHWHEVLIYAARIAGTDRGVNVADRLVHGETCDDYQRSAPVTENDWRAAILAGWQLIEVGLQDVVTDNAYRPVCKRVSSWLLRLIETLRLLPVAERIEAGNLLGRLGDPRFETAYKDGQPHYILPPLAYVPAGPFEMGSAKGEQGADTDEYSTATRNKRHVVDVAEFWISQYPVTNAEYYLFVATTGATPPQHWREGGVPPGLETHPVVYVSWHEARAYCEWLSIVSGRNARLPTEAEWEKAARWDAKVNHSRVYPWGDEWDAAKCNTDESGLGTTTPVGLYPDGVSPVGLFDVAGNVWEWTSTRKEDYPYNPNDGREDPAGDDWGVLRGGSWNFSQDYARCAFRPVNHPDSRRVSFGFRCCLSPGSRRSR